MASVGPSARLLASGTALGAVGGMAGALLAEAALPDRYEPFLGGAILVVGWFVIDLLYRASSPPDRLLRLSLVLAFGLMPVSAMLAAGPVWGMYGFLWPLLVLTPIALLGSIARSATGARHR